MIKMVEATGFEPTTSASRTLRATNCATPRFSNILRHLLYFDLFILILPEKDTRVLSNFFRLSGANFLIIIAYGR